MGFRGMDTNASTALRIEMAKARGADADRALAVRAAFDECPSCGAVGVYVDRKAPR